MRRLLLVLIATAGCSERHEHHAREEHRAASQPVVVEPAPQAHSGDAPHVAPVPPNPRAAHPIEVTLRSSPPGATAAVDGTPVGTTPAFWGGDADGHEHEFTFELKGYALARYRFVPITSGVVHARLEPITEETDAGVSPEIAVPAAGAVLVNPPPAAPADAYIPPTPPPNVPGDVAAPPGTPPLTPQAAAAADAGAAPQPQSPPMGPQP